MSKAPDWKGFGLAIMEEWWMHEDIEASEKFDLALLFDILEPIPGGFDPETHCDEFCASEPGDPWYQINRTDISNALIAAAYEAAAGKCHDDAGRFDTPDRIRALTPSDARAAYDAAIRAAKIEGMREAGKAIEDAGYYCIPPYEGTGNLDQQITYSNDAITALIEETEKGGDKHGPLRTTKNVPV